MCCPRLCHPATHPILHGLTRTRVQLPLGLLTAAQGHPMLVELKNGETLNGHLISCDTWMNLTLKEVVHTSAEGDRFHRLPEVYVRGNNVRGRQGFVCLPIAASIASTTLYYHCTITALPLYYHCITTALTLPLRLLIAHCSLID